ncbi:2-hydroxyacid dehydrogenase [Cobetia amphilecti]|uniref:2-hydroxyacid dehydrogenase n=1 Tax=Cobetia amphilecti TaxID=1055104 RepID=UPI001C07F731|nr:D-glycerate dehydrogenase [Cobetia amphilecti]
MASDAANPLPRRKVVVLKALDDDQMSTLREHHEVAVLPEGLSAQAREDALRDVLHDAHGLISSGHVITPSLLDAAPNLRVTCSVSVGYDNYPLEAMNGRGILLCNTPDVLTETTADTGFLLIMATARRAVELACKVRDGQWTESLTPSHFGTDVHGKTLGMIGMGRIGAAIARRGALGFNMCIQYSNASPKPELESELGATRVELDSLLKTSDFVCVTVPLSEQTERLIGKRELELMPASAFLINIARGRVIDEGALIECLERGGIRGAGLDVFEQEPLPASSPLTRLPQVVALPHIGSATHETRRAMAQRALDNLLLALAGESPLSAVNEAHWTRRYHGPACQTKVLKG